jgi:hypothetical protein
VKRVRARFGDHGHLTDGAELRGVVGGVDTNLLERFDILRERPDLRLTDTVTHGGAVDAPMRLIRAATGEPDCIAGGSL